MEKLQRSFIPGSNWIYFKIYGGEKTLDNILSNDIFLIIRKLKKDKYINKWFFIRYADPESHIRVRLLLNRNENIADVIAFFYKILNRLFNDNLIWKVQIDTYTRELERYDFALIDESESIFCYDSECILSCLRILNKDLNEDWRWKLSLKMIDVFLNDFSFDIHMKRNIMEHLSFSFKKEFGFNEFNSKQFNIKYREYKSIVEYMIENTKSTDNIYMNLCKIIEQRSNKIKPIINNILIYFSKKSVEIMTNQIICSYIHMMLNRIFRSKNRIHELIIYDFLRRYYTSKEAKIKYKQS